MRQSPRGGLQEGEIRQALAARRAAGVARRSGGRSRISVLAILGVVFVVSWIGVSFYIASSLGKDYRRSETNHLGSSVPANPSANVNEPKPPRKPIHPGDSPHPPSVDVPPNVDPPAKPNVPNGDFEKCKRELLSSDKFEMKRNFKSRPIQVAFQSIRDGPWNKECDIPCKFVSFGEGRSSDALMSSVIFGGGDALGSWNGKPEQKKVMLGMESASNYAQLRVDGAHKSGYDIVMTTDLDSDVPAPYFSWVEYNFMAPLQEKTEPAAVSAFISNCGTGNMAHARLKVLEKLMELGVKVDSYGQCLHNRKDDRSRKKTEMMRLYKFSFATENTNEQDYVTEKLYQCFDAGTVPIVIAPDNAHDFEPSPNSMLMVNDFASIEELAERIMFLDTHPEEYEKMVQWKRDGVSDQFKALVDLSSAHSRCRLCIKLGDYARERELEDAKRKCTCTAGSETLHHVLVRERSRFHFRDIFLSQLTIDELYFEIQKAFAGVPPVWAKERPGWSEGDDLKIYSVFPAGITPRKSLYGGEALTTDAMLSDWVQSHPCGELEAIFV